eukprot:gene3831-4088_t
MGRAAALVESDQIAATCQEREEAAGREQPSRRRLHLVSKHAVATPPAHPGSHRALGVSNASKSTVSRFAVHRRKVKQNKINLELELQQKLQELQLLADENYQLKLKASVLENVVQLCVLDMEAGIELNPHAQEQHWLQVLQGLLLTEEQQKLFMAVFELVAGDLVAVSRQRKALLTQAAQLVVLSYPLVPNALGMAVGYAKATGWRPTGGLLAHSCVTRLPAAAARQQAARHPLPDAPQGQGADHQGGGIPQDAAGILDEVQGGRLAAFAVILEASDQAVKLGGPAANGTSLS